MAAAGYEIGIDIGGTFTDVVCYQDGKPFRSTKISSTRQEPGQAVAEAVRFIFDEWGVAPSEIARFLHGTTVATNAVLERKGAKLGLLTTKGFRDVLEIGRQKRQTLYAITLTPETPVFLAPRAYRKEITGRIDSEGREVVALDEDEVLSVVERLVAHGAAALAICYLFSFKNPKHEQRTREIIIRRFPALPVSISSDVDPAFREYERTVVTAFDAYMKPVIGGYMAQIEGGLHQAGIKAPLQVMQSRGGLAASAVVLSRPVRLFMSGPAAGVIGGTHVGKTEGFQNLITVDIGGTSSDIALVNRGDLVIKPEAIIDTYSVRVPMVDVNAIGSGGGSIATIDAGGGLRVGPESAGSDPGPAAYCKGGEEPTVTDASLVLGYLNPRYFAGGRVTLDVPRAREVIAQKVAAPLGLKVEEAALGIHRVVNAQMVEGIRLASVRQGFDPRLFTLVALGGAGPIHAAALASELGINKVVIPRMPGVLSATGLLLAPVEHEVSVAHPVSLANLSIEAIRSALAKLDLKCQELMRHESVDSGMVRVKYYADMCYVGQSYYVEVPFDAVSDGAVENLYRDFLAAHDRIYGHAVENPARIVNLRSVHTVPRTTPFKEVAPPNEIQYTSLDREVSEEEQRMIYVSSCPDGIMAKVYNRSALPVGMRVEGPAIIEQEDTTTIIPPGWVSDVTSNGNLILSSDSINSDAEISMTTVGRW